MIDLVLPRVDCGRLIIAHKYTPDIEYVFDLEKREYDRVRLSKPVRMRTTGDGSQNHHINGHCAEIAAQTGNDFDTVKTACKYEAISAGYPFDTIRTRVIPWSETRIDTVQAGILIDTIHRIAAEFGVALTEAE